MFSVDVIDPRMCGPYYFDHCDKKTTGERYLHKTELQTMCQLPSTTSSTTTPTTTNTTTTTTTITPTTGEGQQHSASSSFAFIKDHVINNAKHTHKQQLWDQHFDSQPHHVTAVDEVVSSTCRLVFIHKKTTNESVKYCKTLKSSLDGWDILVARSWTNTIWTSLLLSGAVPVGREEMDFVRTTRAIPVFPNDYPDTATGTVHSAVLCSLSV